jgi:hypothetical protein
MVAYMQGQIQVLWGVKLIKFLDPSEKKNTKLQIQN